MIILCSIMVPDFDRSNVFFFGPRKRGLDVSLAFTGIGTKVVWGHALAAGAIDWHKPWTVPRQMCTRCLHNAGFIAKACQSESKH